MTELTGTRALLRRVDRFAAGRRQRDLRAPAHLVGTPAARRAFVAIAWLLALDIVVGAAAIGIALIHLIGGTPDNLAVWIRGTVVLGLTVSVGYFAWRASQGWYWSYSRMRLFAWIFPVVTLTIAAIPGLYPTWMIIEQIVFAALMIAIAVIASSRVLRTAFAPGTLRRAHPDEP
jgi:hypothetical protein